MKTILIMVEVEDKDHAELCEALQDLLDNPDECVGRITAYSTYDEGDKIPDIMNKERCQ